MGPRHDEDSRKQRSTLSFSLHEVSIDGMPTILFDAAAEAFKATGEDYAFMKMRPLRFIELPASIAALDPTIAYSGLNMRLLLRQTLP